MKFLVPIIVLVKYIDLTYQAEWTYEDETKWPGACKSGSQQSPIDILSVNAVVDHRGRYIKSYLDFRGYKAVDIVGVNNGHTLLWKKVPGGPAPTMSGGPLQGNYTFLQFHIHLLSEHAIDGHKYPMEIHLVHVKTGLDFDEALNIPDGLVVIGIFCQVKHNKGSDFALGEIMEDVPNLVKHTDKEPTTATIIDMERLFSPYPQSYYTYNGSLTTPQCNEAVQWIVMDNPISMSDVQYKQLSKVHLGGIANYRSLQPTNCVVYRSATSCSSLMVPGLLSAISVMYHCSKILFNNAMCKVWNAKNKMFGWDDAC